MTIKNTIKKLIKDHTHKKEQYMTGLFKCFNRFDSFGFLIEVILEIGILQCSLCCHEESYEKELDAGVLKTTTTKTSNENT